MAPPRKHETDVILDAARAIVLTDGPRAASIAAIAKSSGAPAGTLYHRFGNRDGILAAAWLRSLERFQTLALAATGDTALESAVAMAVSAVEFARKWPDDARLLLTIRPSDLLDGPGDEFGKTLAAMNRPLVERVELIARELHGHSDVRTVAAVSRAIVDLPYAVVKRYAHGDLPRWLADDLAEDARVLLSRPVESIRGQRNSGRKRQS
jgi:AcrR family transcriptional regulator